MARYYEEETLFQSAKDELLKYFSDSFVYTSAELFHKVLANTPTADVVPKSEVEKFAEEIKLEFYREFDEIIPSIMADKIDDLVKKYTEEK